MLRTCLKVAQNGVGRFPVQGVRREPHRVGGADAVPAGVGVAGGAIAVARRTGAGARVHCCSGDDFQASSAGRTSMSRRRDGKNRSASSRWRPWHRDWRRAHPDGGTPEFLGNAGLLLEKDDVDGLATHLDRLDSRRRDPQRLCCARPAPGGNVPVGPRVAWLHGVYPSVMALSQAIVVPITSALCLRHPWFL